VRSGLLGEEERKGRGEAVMHGLLISTHFSSPIHCDSPVPNASKENSGIISSATPLGNTSGKCANSQLILPQTAYGAEEAVSYT